MFVASSRQLIGLRHLRTDARVASAKGDLLVLAMKCHETCWSAVLMPSQYMVLK